MAESAVLLRSFSHPSDASREGDPIRRALTESISFGRFMSESLAWEKWSTFSHNHYLEEVEKFSKPGSVAEKKAYFEAHYKKKAAMKAAAVEEANADATDAPELKTADIQDNSPTDLEPAKENSQMAIIEQKEQYMIDTITDCHMDTGSADKISKVTSDEQLKNNNVNTEVAPVDANASYSINIRDDLGDANGERVETVIEYPDNAENATQANNLKQLQNPDVHDDVEATSLERIPHEEAINQENSASSSKKKLASCSTKSSSQSRVSRLTSYTTKRAPSLPARNVNNIATNSEEAVGDSNGKKRVVPKSLHKSINFSPRISETSKASLKTPTRVSVNGISKHVSKLFQSEDKRSKALVSKSVSGGITEAARLQSPSTEGLKSSSSKGSKTQPPYISSPFSFKSEERVAKRKEFFQKLEEKNNAKEAENSLHETRSKDKAEPDLKKLRQSTSFKARQNESLYHGSHLPNTNSHMKKEKAEEHDFKKLRQSIGFKATPNAPSPTNQMKKKPICSPKLGGKLKPTPSLVLDTSGRPPRRPSAVNTESSKSKTWSVTSLPKLGKRPTSKSNTVQDAHARPPWRTSMNSASFKHGGDGIEKNNGSTIHRSVASLPRKNAHENASPNIQDAHARPPWRTSMNSASFKHGGGGIEKNNGSTIHRSVASLPKKNAHENASPNIQH